MTDYHSADLFEIFSIRLINGILNVIRSESIYPLQNFWLPRLLPRVNAIELRNFGPGVWVKEEFYPMASRY